MREAMVSKIDKFKFCTPQYATQLNLFIQLHLEYFLDVSKCWYIN